MTSSVRPTNAARVSMLMQTDLLMNNIRSVSVDLLKVQNQMSTGLKLARPSDNPTDASSIMNLDGMLERYDQYLTNIDHADTSLKLTDAALTGSIELVQNAYTLAQDSIGKNKTYRDGNATVLIGIINGLVMQANAPDGSSGYIFSGQNAGVAPFEKYKGGVMFYGSGDVMTTRIDPTNLQSFSVNAAEAFGSLSSQVVGIADLDPNINADTLLSDLNGATGGGIRLGSILVSDGVVTESVDLANCVTVGDVISKLNGSGVGLTAGINAAGNGLTITSANPDLTIRENGSGTAAHNLGIFDDVGGDDIITGQDEDARLTPATLITALAGGAGIDVASGLQITNSLIGTRTIDLSAAQNVEDILNAINNADLGLRAEINADGTGINVFNQLSGSKMSIGENGGTTASDLGIRSMGGSTLLSDLNGGGGVHPAVSGAADIRITDRLGATYDVSLDGAETVQDVIDRINTATGGAVTAGLAAVGNGLELTDTTGGAGDLSVTGISQEGFFISQELGWGKDGQSVSSNTLTGEDINPVEPQGLFSHLLSLYDALIMDDDANGSADKAITAIAPLIDESRQTLSKIHGQVGGIQKGIEQRKANIEDSILSIQTMRSDLQDVDFTEAITRYQNLYTALQGNLMTGGLINSTSLLDFLQ
jgi:flagellar hook-associated protein 3 FlgL